jgi:hypothetical protein
VKSWPRRSLLDWTLAHERTLPVIDVIDPGGEACGWLIGHPLDLDAKTLVEGSVSLPLPNEGAVTPAALERWLYRFGGRFVLVVLRPFQRVYLDAVGSLPVVFAPGRRAVSSSPFLLPAEFGDVVDDPLVETLSIARTDLWFMLGSSPLSGSERLLPNHVLDLADWTVTRLWPLEPFDELDVDTGLETIAATLEKTMTALAVSATPSIGITSGLDSRALLACARAELDRLRFYTVAIPDDSGTIDMHTAPALAAKLGLDHRRLAWIRPRVEDVERFMVQTGCMVGEVRGRLEGPTLAQLDTRGADVTGLGGETVGGFGRGRGWHIDDGPETRLSAGNLLDRYGFPRDPGYVDRLTTWLAGLSGIAPTDVLALFQLEMRFGCWGGALTTAHPDVHWFTTYPYGHRAILDAALRMPWEYRRTASLQRDIIGDSGCRTGEELRGARMRLGRVWCVGGGGCR